MYVSFWVPWLKAFLVDPDPFYCATTCPLIRNWDKITINIGRLSKSVSKAHISEID